MNSLDDSDTTLQKLLRLIPKLHLETFEYGAGALVWRTRLSGLYLSGRCVGTPHQHERFWLVGDGSCGC